MATMYGHNLTVDCCDYVHSMIHSVTMRNYKFSFKFFYTCNIKHM